MQDPVGGICAAVGESVLRRLVTAFYQRVASDDLLRPMYPEEDLTEAEQRLADFLVGRFGGPDEYVRRRGHPRLRMRHAPFPIDKNARDRWMELMRGSLSDVEFPDSHRNQVCEFLDGVATFLINS
jgi:hemoglobin